MYVLFMNLSYIKHIMSKSFMLRIKKNVRVKAISLVEISISLLIIGLVLAGAYQGIKYLKTVQTGNTANQIVQIKVSLEAYKKAHAGKAPAADNFWKELEPFGGPNSADNKVKSDLGPTYQIEDNKIKLIPIDPPQASNIKNNLDLRDDESTGWLKHENGGLEMDI